MTILPTVSHQLYNMSRLAEALGFDRGYTWRLVHQELALIEHGHAGAGHLIPAAYLYYPRKNLYELLFSAEQIQAAQRIRQAREAGCARVTP